MLTPGEIIRRTRSPWSTFSPNSGSLNSVTLFLCVPLCPLWLYFLTVSRIRLLGIDSLFLNRSLRNFRCNLLLSRQGIQGREHDVLGIDLKEISQRCPIFTAPKAIGSQRNQLPRHPF